MNSGAFANQTGDSLEAFIENVLIDNGYQEMSTHIYTRQTIFANRHRVEGRRFMTGVYAGEDLYKTRRRCDFLVLNPDVFPGGLVIEAKWQQSPGSAHEKYPFLVGTIEACGVPTIVLLDGEGYAPNAARWLREQVSAARSLLAVYNLREFLMASNNGLFSGGRFQRVAPSSGTLPLF